MNRPRFLCWMMLLFLGSIALSPLAANPIPSGACCLSNETCELQGRLYCWGIGGIYLGDFTYCDPNPCVLGVGACCLPDSSCAVMDSSACQEAGGRPMGQYTTCDPCNSCESRSGACCIDESCSIVIGSDCCASGGWFFPGVTTCDGVLCSTPARPTSWGRIKSLYR